MSKIQHVKLLLQANYRTPSANKRDDYFFLSRGWHTAAPLQYDYCVPRVVEVSLTDVSSLRQKRKVTGLKLPKFSGDIMVNSLFLAL